MGAVGVVADRGTNADELAGGDRGAHTGAADEDAALDPAVLDRLAELARLVRIVDPHRVGVGAEVDHVVSGERSQDLLPQMHATVVEGHPDLHTRSIRAVARATTLSRL